MARNFQGPFWRSVLARSPPEECISYAHVGLPVREA